MACFVGDLYNALTNTMQPEPQNILSTDFINMK